jgi:hypothetical protein
MAAEAQDMVTQLHQIRGGSDSTAAQTCRSTTRIEVEEAEGKLAVTKCNTRLVRRKNNLNPKN